MLVFAIRRLLLAVPVLWGVMTLVFLSIHLLPGDPAQIMLYGKGTTNTADVIALRHQLGLDQPIAKQYVDFMKGAAHLDFGESFSSKRPVFTEIMDRFPTTLKVAALAMLFSLLIGFLVGTGGALFRLTPLGRVVTVGAIVGISIPEFWSGPMFALFFGLKLGWLPVAGIGSIRYFILPAATLSIGIGSFLARIVRASLTGVLDTDYIRTARAKGLSGYIVLVRHALRNALIPIVTVVGLIVAGLLGGVVIVENVFALPGLGTLAVNSVMSRDFPVIEGTTFFFAAILIAANLLVDISYGLVDPRIRTR